MYCHECGAETDETQNFCMACGAELRYQSGENRNQTSKGSPTAGGGSPSSIETSSEGDTDAERMEAEGTQPSVRESAPDRGSWFEMSRVFENAGSEDSGAGNAADQSRELATNALFGYGFLVLIRVTGVSRLVYYFGSAGGSGSRLYDLGTFVFYDGFVFALVGLLTSGYLVARFYFDFGEIADDLEMVDRAAAIGLPGSSLLYGLGALAAFLV